MEQSLEQICETAANQGIFLPLMPAVSVLDEPTELCGRSLTNRSAVMVAPCFDADADGAPTQQTIDRYVAAAKSRSCGMLWSEPIAVCADGRQNANQLVLSAQNLEKFRALCKAVQEAAPDTLLIALLDHAGRNALRPLCFERCPIFAGNAEIIADTEVTPIAAFCGNAAETASQAGFGGIALSVCERNLFADSLAAFHRDGVFGGDFDDRSRFVRDCYTAMKLTAKDALLAIRLCLSDGLPQPYCFGMAFEDESAPELSESVLLLQILRALYGVELVACEVGITGINWLNRAESEDAVLTAGRLCTCTAMLDSALQQDVSLLIPEHSVSTEIPFANLAAGMITDEFASFAGFIG